MKALVVQADALQLPLADATVDLIVTSPPYFALRSYRDGDEHYAGQIGSEATPAEFLEALWAATREMVRVLKPAGSIFVNLGDKYAGSGGHNNAGISRASQFPVPLGADGKPEGQRRRTAYEVEEIGDLRRGAARRNAPDRYNQNSGGIPAKSLMGLPWRYAIGCIDQLGLILRAEIVWNKPNGLPESVTDRVRRSHETWFHLTKQGRYFSAVDEVREPHGRQWDTDGSTTHYQNGTAKSQSVGGPKFSAKAFSGGANPLGKLPGSVWTIPSEPLLVPQAALARLDLPDHFAAFPQEWPRRLILGWSPSGICVACGEGRRPVVAKRLANVWHDKQLVDTRYAGTRDAHQHNRMGQEKAFGSTEASITGYACACDAPLAPTRPAVVLDPFGGTGTTAMVARALGRIGVSVDLSHAYGRLARWRIFESDAWHKAEARTWAERPRGTAVNLAEIDLFAQAACREAPSDWFVLPKEGTEQVSPRDYSKARSFCRSCAIRVECLDYALRNRIDMGCWGGLSPVERDSLRRRRHRAARLEGAT